MKYDRLDDAFWRIDQYTAVYIIPITAHGQYISYLVRTDLLRNVPVHCSLHYTDNSARAVHILPDTYWLVEERSPWNGVFTNLVWPFFLWCPRLGYFSKFFCRVAWYFRFFFVNVFRCCCIRSFSCCILISVALKVMLCCFTFSTLNRNILFYFHSYVLSSSYLL